MPTWDDGPVRALACQLRLALRTRRRRAVPGARLSDRPGSSLEFHDYRAYQAGDDLRHLDWSAWARTGQLILRRHRQESGLRTELLLDCSASMGLTGEKSALATGLVALFVHLARAASPTSPVRIWLLGARAAPLDTAAGPEWIARLQDAEIGGAAGLQVRPPPPLLAGSERILVSDGLCPEGGAAVVRRLGVDAGSVCLVQVLAEQELHPRSIGPSRLRDLEGGEADVVLDDMACRAYRTRLDRHQRGWQNALAGRGLGVVTCRVEDGLPGAVRQLCASGLCEVAAR